MARAVSRIQGATAIIVPYDVESRIARVDPDALAARVARETAAETEMLRAEAD
jgi:hypothetical protein